ncbi:MAG: cobalt-precorrin-5B (C(1))-methyltransferase [Methanomicrobium sp.]|nr:cobalt-precorrin-5B (C(1))-methyltransferase [Methanomicrobium sp.]MDD4299200.1 cobalt-precorrin-5B (C(1))-methyltransferase [Methanomicrobium sp.]
MIKDPVTGYEYPGVWVSACKDTESLNLAKSGLGVLTSTGAVLKRGFTTGTTAAAACRAAVLSLKNPVTEVSVKIPCGLKLNIPAKGAGGAGRCRKYSGDYKDDITSGILFCAKAEEKDSGIEIIAGTGIGRYARDTPRFKKGESAISKTAMDCILSSVREALEEIQIAGVLVELFIPAGEKTALHTLNPKVGIEGGISVLGSTGLVEPWDDHLTESALERIKGLDKVVLTTGRVGLRYSRLMFADYEAVLVGKYMQKGIDAAEGLDDVILCGLPALILKFINPGILEGTGYETVEELSASPKWPVIVSENLAQSKKIYPYLRVVLIDRNGKITGDSG